MSDVLIKGGRVIDPGAGVEDALDLRISEGKVTQVGVDLAADGATTIDATGLIVAPGFVDLHAHLSEPGGEHRETIASGTRAAAAGGYTSLCAMPTTDPVVDDPAAVGFIRAEGVRAGTVRVYPVSTVSVGGEGKALTEFGEVVDAGAIAFGDAGSAIGSTSLMRLALEYAQTFNVPVLTHPDDPDLSNGGVMHEGVVSTRLGLKGVPGASEIIGLSRDLSLAEMTGGRLHVQRVSLAASVDLIRAAKERGVPVSAEVTPHHLVLTHDAVDGYGTEHKVEPPLRTDADVQAVRSGLAEGVLDAVATDHAPRHYDEKETAFGDAPSGVVGLETAFAVLHTTLVGEGVMELETLLRRMSTAPAEIMGLPAGTLAEGAPGDVVLIDRNRRWTIDPTVFESKSRNTPFGGWNAVGRVVQTFVGGRSVWRLG
ncbi:MAG: dihydroorotase [Longimicrobiales bacterium]